MQAKPGRTRLVARAKLCPLRETVDQTPHRRLIVKDDLHVGNLFSPPQNPHSDLVLACVHPQVDWTSRLCDTGLHNGRLLPVWLLPLQSG